MTRLFRLAGLSGWVLGAWLIAAPLPADPATFASPALPAATAGQLIIEDEAPVDLSTEARSIGLPEGIEAASPALDLFDPANPDPTYIPPGRRFAAPGQEPGPETMPALEIPALNLPSRLDLPASMAGFPMAPGTTAGADERATGKTASPTASADRSAWPVLSPNLIRAADFAAAAKTVAEASATVTLQGRIIPEDQPLKRRVFYRRWAIQTPAGERYPLSSNLPVMQAVKQKGILDGQVSITGRWNQAKGEPRLRFFIAEQVRVLEPAAETASGTSLETPRETASGTASATWSEPMPRSPVETASGIEPSMEEPIGSVLASIPESASDSASDSDPTSAAASFPASFPESASPALSSIATISPPVALATTSTTPTTPTTDTPASLDAPVSRDAPASSDADAPVSGDPPASPDAPAVTSSSPPND